MCLLILKDNTLAADFDEVVPKNVRSKRSKMLRGLSLRKEDSFMKLKLEKVFF